MNAELRGYELVERHCKELERDEVYERGEHAEYDVEHRLFIDYLFKYRLKLFHLLHLYFNIESEQVGIFVKYRLNFAVNKLLRLLRGAADEVFGLHYAVKLLARYAESAVCGYSVEQVVLAALDLDYHAGIHGVNADLLVQLLPVSAALDRLHHDIFRRHKRQFLEQVLLYHLRIYHKSVRNIYAQVEHRIRGEESLGDTQALVRRVVERAFKPLRAGGHGGVLYVRYNISRKRGYSLASHWVALICHGG